MTKRLVFIFFTVFALTVQAQKPLSTDTAVSDQQPGAEWIDEGQKIGRFATTNNIEDWNIFIRKAKDRSGNLLQKEVVIENSFENSRYTGYIDISEIDQAIGALAYILDSLLPQKPTGEFAYTKDFTGSNFRIMAWFDPDARSPKWGIKLMLDTYFPDSVVFINESDLLKLILTLETAEKRLKDF
jgi:hypothetical protein